MPAGIAPASFQNVDKAFEICVDVSMRMIDRMAYASLSRKVEDHRKPIFCKQRSYLRAVRKIGLREAEPCILAQEIQSSLLQRGIIVTVETVQADNITAFSQQLASDV